MPNQKVNPCNRPNFEAACALLKIAAPKCDFEIRSVPMFGELSSWETIRCQRFGAYGKSSYQMLYPRERDRLQAATSPTEIADIVNTLFADQHDLLGL